MKRISAAVVAGFTAASFLLPAPVSANPAPGLRDSPKPSVQAAASSKVALVGRVAVGDADVRGAAVKITDARTGRVLARAKTNRQGFFIVPKVRNGARLLVSSAGGRVSGQKLAGTLVSNYRTTSTSMVWVTPESTVLAAVDKKRPQFSDAAAARRTRAALGLLNSRRVTLGLEHARFSAGQMSANAFLRAAKKAGGVDQLLCARARLAVKGKSGKPFSAPGVRALGLGDAGIFIGKSLASGAVGAVGSLAMGWFMAEVGIPSPPSSEFVAEEQQLAGISSQIDQLSSQVAQISTQMAAGFSTVEAQLTQLQQSINASQYHQTYEAAQPIANQVSTQLQQLQGLISTAATDPGQAATIHQTAATILNGWTANAAAAPTTEFDDLVDLISSTPGVGSIYKQLYTVLAGPAAVTLNPNASTLLQNAYSYWQSMLTGAFYLALEFAHAANIDSSQYVTAYNQAIGCQISAANCTPALAAPTPLPDNAALQTGQFCGSAGGRICWSIPGAALAPGAGQGLLWVTDFVGGLTTPAPVTQASWIAELTPTNGALPGSLTAADGTSVGPWYPGDVANLNQLAATSVGGNDPSQTVPLLLGFSAQYTSALQDSGFWDLSGACGSASVYLTNDVSANGGAGFQCTSTGSGAANTGSAYLVAQSLVNDVSIYLPAS